MKKIILLLFIASLFSCEQNTTILDSENLLIGSWVNTTYKDNKTTFSRANNLPDNNYGISFKVNGDFVERTSGFCGTPPLSYFNIDGTFHLENNLINISTNSYPISYALRIISLTETTLVVEREFTEQEKEHQKLMELFNEVQNLAYSVSCSNAKNWLFTKYGAKACGGPQGFIAYSNQIDTNAFLQKVETYTQAEKDFNIKWGIISDCSVTKTPISVECKNGFPILKY